MYSKQEKRFYPVYSPGKPSTQVGVEYTLWFDEKNKLVDIRNEHMVSVERDSECFEFFDKKYNNL